MGLPLPKYAAQEAEAGTPAFASDSRRPPAGKAWAVGAAGAGWASRRRADTLALSFWRRVATKRGAPHQPRTPPPPPARGERAEPTSSLVSFPTKRGSKGPSEEPSGKKRAGGAEGRPGPQRREGLRAC